MNYGRSMLASYWRVPWLRVLAYNRLREEHVARWAFKTGDVIVWPHCWDGRSNHYGVITKMVRTESRQYAMVRMECREGELEVGTIFLKRPLPPYPKTVLDLVHALRVERKGKPSNNVESG